MGTFWGSHTLYNQILTRLDSRFARQESGDLCSLVSRNITEAWTVLLIHIQRKQFRILTVVDYNDFKTTYKLTNKNSLEEFSGNQINGVDETSSRL